MGMLANRGTFGTVCAQVKRAVPSGLLTRPDAVFNFGQNRTAHRTVGADGFQNLDFAFAGRLRRCGLDPTDGPDGGDATNGQT